MQLLAGAPALVAMAAAAATDVLVPVAGRRPGEPASVACTSVVVHNPTAAVTEVRLLPLFEGVESATVSPLVVSLAPGEVNRIDDVTKSVCKGRACGALLVVSAARATVCWAPCGTAGASPSTRDTALHAAVPVALAVGVGERTDVPAGAAGCRLTIAEVAGRKARVQVVPHDAGGAPLAEAVECDVGAWSTATFRCAEWFPDLAVPVDHLTVTPMAGNGRLACLGDPSDAADEP